MKISWPQACRAESSATAYRTALDWIKHKPVEMVIAKLEEKIKEKEETLAAYRKQVAEERAAKNNAEYQKQAHETDLLNE